MLSLTASLAWAQPLDRVVAVAGDQIVLASDVQLIEALKDHDPSAMPIWIPTEGRAIALACLRELASDVSVYAPRPEQVAARFDSVRDSFATDAEFVAFMGRRGLRDEDLYAILRRRMTVEQYVRRNVDISPEDDRYPGEVKALLDDALERVTVRQVDPMVR